MNKLTKEELEIIELALKRLCKSNITADFEHKVIKLRVKLLYNE
jgi:hypothetical protein